MTLNESLNSLFVFMGCLRAVVVVEMRFILTSEIPHFDY